MVTKKEMVAIKWAIVSFHLLMQQISYNAVSNKQNAANMQQISYYMQQIVTFSYNSENMHTSKDKFTIFSENMHIDTILVTNMHNNGEIITMKGKMHPPW